METIEIGKSVKGRAIVMHHIEPVARKRSILVIGGIHGDEIDAQIITDQFVKKIAGQTPLSALYIIPCLNPDGRETATRHNANGIDLNRNFPTKDAYQTDRKGQFKSVSPLSEPESFALWQMISLWQFQTIITLHRDFDCIDYDGLSTLRDIMRRRKLSRLLNLPIKKLGAKPGSMGSYFGKERKIPFFTVEFHADQKKEYHQRQAHALAKVLTEI